ncbi:acetyl-CoA carboxylase biotin carboxyl carrier protein [Epilithonimonas hispanica]|uniref:Biotin carboxyl carrier protein of acetyl-CoA carboxylase n=1 Tax=Epilithonimonas hispanica TaxID=358687 RepID=A0A3D9D291_9FLAO|nr:acetyl-CoA carboxylase biotin carboxyl carrier protein [Epilithonimonas hispanica]REC72074.1 acetyl-CoA carboxylase, biotin carboxyl carrier protein [Epilithonimonas hispanica]
MDIKDIQNLVRFVAKAGVSEVKYKNKDFEIYIKTPLGGEPVSYVTPQVAYQAPVSAPVANTASPVANTEATSSADDSKYITIKSPMIGTFYRKPSPDKEAFANVGDSVTEGKVVCVIEAMKLFNQIESEVSGKIVKILVEDSSPVEYDQPLFLVDPS